MTAVELPRPDALDGLPDLRRPAVIAAFEGWNDAGDAASGALDHLERLWAATPLAALDPEDYYDFQVTRPLISFDDVGGRRLSWPTTRLSVASPQGADRDVVLVRGIEPNMRWRQFCRELLDVVVELGADTVVTLGALLADTPHTRPTPVTGTTTDPQLAEELGLLRSTYEGPTGVVGVLQDAVRERGLSGVSLWGAVPHYVAQPPNPKATLALLRRVEDLLDLEVPVDDLPEEAAAWESTVDELAREDDDVAEYVAALERREAEDLSQTSGEDLAGQLERYLRRRGGGAV